MTFKGFSFHRVPFCFEYAEVQFPNWNLSERYAIARGFSETELGNLEWKNVPQKIWILRTKNCLLSIENVCWKDILVLKIQIFLCLLLVFVLRLSRYNRQYFNSYIQFCEGLWCICCNMLQFFGSLSSWDPTARELPSNLRAFGYWQLWPIGYGRGRLHCLNEYTQLPLRHCHHDCDASGPPMSQHYAAFWLQWTQTNS